jgi:hypothetical protein
MASVGPMNQGMKQTRGYFVPLANCANKISTYNGGSGAGGSFLPGTFTVATWASNGTGASPLTSTISTIGAGGLLRDMGKTVVSSNRTFRKVQLITPSLNGGVTGVDTTSGPYLTGYIELAVGNQVVSGATPATIAQVAYMPGLL